MKRLAISSIAISSLLVLAGCGVPRSQPSPPPIEPVTPGFIWSYDHQLNFGFEYPEDWETQVPECKFPLEKVRVFNKTEEPTRIVISVKSTNLISLVEVKAFGYIAQQSILKEKFAEINDREAYEVIFKQYPDKKAK